MRANARGDNGRLLLAVLLKSRRDFGCFPGLGEVHAGIVVHVASQLGLETRHPPTDAMRRSSKLYRYQAAVRAHLGVRPYGKWAERLLTGTILDAAETMSDPADLINRAIQACSPRRRPAGVQHPGPAGEQAGLKSIGGSSAGWRQGSRNDAAVLDVVGQAG